MHRIDDTANRHQSYALLTIEQCMLLVPQREVRTLESVLDIRIEQPPTRGVGWLSFELQDWPVYGMDAALNPLSEIPASQRICVVLTHAEGYFGILCSDITTVQGTSVEFRPLPPAMVKPRAPLSALALFEDRVGILSTVMSLAAHLDVQVEVLTTT